MFSVPLNPKLSPDQFDYFLKFLKKHKHLIYDVYFTSRIPPFSQDAMGDVYKDSQFDLLLDNALIIPKETGIPLSATFNNIEVPPTMGNLDLLIKNYKKLYDKGVKIVTIPHTLWMLTGKFQKAYPDVLVKNTILRNVQRPNEVVKAVEAGFHYINFDRDLMRDEDTLKRMQDVRVYCKKKFNVDVKYSLLANEGCWGNCPVQDEHFLYNNTRSRMTDPTYFGQEISYFSCPMWEENDPAYMWRVANFPPWKAEWDRLLTYIDVVKMHGRENVPRLFETMRIIERYEQNNPILFEEFEEYVKDNKFPGKRINVWRETIRNCKFNCWDCNVCDRIVEANTKVNLADAVKKALSSSKAKISKINNDVKALPGLTAEKVKHFVNKLCELPEARYLELGVFQGAIFSSALYNNTIYAIAVDNWQGKNTAPARPEVNIKAEVGNDREIFVKNLRKYIGKSEVKIYQGDFLGFDLKQLPWKSNILFYDGDHSIHNDILPKWDSAMDNQFVFIVDDWNWDNVRVPTLESIKKMGYKVLYKEEITGKIEDSTDYWNGLGIFVLEKNRKMFGIGQ